MAQTMTPEEETRTDLWFNTTQLKLIRLKEKLQTAIDRVPEIDKPGFIDLQNKVIEELNDVEADERAFFNDSTLLLHPPTPEVVEETKRRCEELGREIDRANKARAVVRLVDDLVGFVQGVRG